MKEVKIYTIVSDQLSPPITGESFCTDMVRHSDYADLEEKCAALALRDDMRQSREKLEAAERRIAELEARTVTPPKNNVANVGDSRWMWYQRDLMWIETIRAAMLQGAEPVSNHDELALYYLQGQKDGLEWAAQLAEANHPLTGDWLYDDPLELAKAIRKGPDMPGFAGSSPVTQDGWISCSERMPDNDESKPIAIFTGKCLGQGMFVATYDDDGFFDYWEGMEIIGVSHWMPLPEPPQEVNRG